MTAGDASNAPATEPVVEPVVEPAADATTEPVVDLAADPAVGAERSAMGAELARMEVGVYSDLRGLFDAAESVRNRAQARGWEHESSRARLVLADVEARTDRIERGAQTERDILVQAMLAGDGLLAARAHHLLGASLDRLGLTTEALAHAADGVHLLPVDAPAHLRVQHTMLLALMSSQQLSGDGFRSSFDQVIADAAALPTPDLLLAALNNFAWLLYERGEIAEASAAVRHMQDVAERSGTPLNSGALDTVARVLLDAGDLARAEQMARAAIAQDSPSVDSFHAGEAMLTLAEIRWRRGDPDGAHLLAVGAEDLARTHAMPEIRALALRLQAKLLAERGDFRGAYEAATAHHEIWETVRSRETDSRAVLLQTVLRTDEARRRSAVYEELAERDPLTGVWNRRHLDNLFPAMLGEHEAGGIPISVALVDLDRFKAVNDLRDHQVGDAALCRVAELVDGELTEPAFTVRLGGDEFLLVLPGTDAPGALEIGERVRARVEREDWAELTEGLDLTITVGVATSTSTPTAGPATGSATGSESPTGSGSTHSELMRHADVNMYRAKRAGRNRVRGPSGEVEGPGGELLDTGRGARRGSGARAEHRTRVRSGWPMDGWPELEPIASVPADGDPGPHPSP